MTSVDISVWLPVLLFILVHIHWTRPSSRIWTISRKQHSHTSVNHPVSRDLYKEFSTAAMTSERTLENQARYLKKMCSSTYFGKWKKIFFIYYLLYLYVVYSSFKNNQLRMNQLTVILNWCVMEHFFYHWTLLV